MALRVADAPGRDTVTVAEVQRVVLPGSRVVGGTAGLTHRVTWATSLRSRPPAFELRGGGELVLASPGALEGLQQVDPTLTLERILEGLVQAGAAAFALPGPINARARATANALSLPLIELPAGLSLLDAERGAIGLVLDRHNELQARASDLYRRLAQVSVEGRGVDGILAEAARIAGRTVLFEDSTYRLRSASAAPEGTVPVDAGAGVSSLEERSRLAEHVRTHPVSATTPAAVLLTMSRLGVSRYAAPVVTAQRVRGYVSLCGDAESLTEFDQLAASRTAAICALELSKEEAVSAAEQRVQRDVVDELLSPTSDPIALARRAAQSGLSEAGPYAVAIFATDQVPSLIAALAAAADLFARRVRSGDSPVVSHVDGGELTVICDLAATTRSPMAQRAASRARASSGAPSVPDASRASGPATSATATAVTIVGVAEGAQDRLRELTDELFEAVSKEIGAAHVSAGVSRPHAPLTALSLAAAEARDALGIGRRVYGTGRLVSYADLGLYRVLHVLRDSAELKSFHEQTLGPLEEYDRRTGQNLIETLEAYFACHGNLSQTAVRLHHHRNSLLYRIGRIQEISGLDLEDADARLSLQVALKARRLV